MCRVSGLKESMAVLSSIAIKHQVLITPNGLSLDNGEALLSSFGSQEPNQNLYLFNLQSTVSQSQIPNLMDLRAFDFKRMKIGLKNVNIMIFSAGFCIEPQPQRFISVNQHFSEEFTRF